MVDELSLDTILVKEATDLSEEEVAHLNEHETQLTDEQKEKFKSVLADKSGDTNGDDDDDKKEKEAKRE